MAPYDSFNTKSTSISYPWPAEIKGIERIALSAQGDLQRVLSAYLSRPINIELVFSETMLQRGPDLKPEPLLEVKPETIATVSATSPIIQTRQVHLMCEGQIACTATSIVRITTPEVAHLFLIDQYPIGQMFRRMKRPPAPELLDVGVGPVEMHLGDAEKIEIFKRGFTSSHPDMLWRRYKLVIPDFDCEILEVFPCRKMFVDGEKWVAGDHANIKANNDSSSKSGEGTTNINVNVQLTKSKQTLLLALLLGATFEGAMKLFGTSVNCLY